MHSSNPGRWTRLEGPGLAAAPAFTLAVYLLLTGWIWPHGIDLIGAGVVMGIVARPPSSVCSFSFHRCGHSVWRRTKRPGRGTCGRLCGAGSRGVCCCFCSTSALIFALFVLKDQLERGPIPSGLSHHPLAGEWSVAACLAGVLFWGFLALFAMRFRVRKACVPAATAPPDAGPTPIGDVRAYAQARVAEPGGMQPEGGRVSTATSPAPSTPSSCLPGIILGHAR